MTRNSWALALLSFAMLAPQTITAARADVVIQSPSVFTIGAPLRVVRTQSSFMLTPLQTLPVMPDRTILLQQSVPQPTTITNSVVLEKNIGDVSDFRHRLQMLSDQIDLGSKSGWLSADAAAGLRAREQELMTQLDAIAAGGTLTRETNDSLEKQINVLNQDVADAASQAQ
jgi:hypothetical protein